jgi:hypothetical protein
MSPPILQFRIGMYGPGYRGGLQSQFMLSLEQTVIVLAGKVSIRALQFLRICDFASAIRRCDDMYVTADGAGKCGLLATIRDRPTL